MKLIMSIRETFYKRKAGVELRDLTKSRLSWKQKSVRLPDSQILSGARKKKTHGSWKLFRTALV